MTTATVTPQASTSSTAARVLPLLIRPALILMVIIDIVLGVLGTFFPRIYMDIIQPDAPANEPIYFLRRAAVIWLGYLVVQAIAVFRYQKTPLFGSVLATAGDLVFAGGTNDRNFRAFDAKTGEVLWQQKTNSGIMGMPMSYEVDGTQYIAIQSGWGVDAQRIQDALSTQNLGIENNVPQGGVVWVFAVKK